MEIMISKLLTSYENSGLTRRELARGSAVLAANSGAASAAGFRGGTINHVSVYVGDLKRSSEFCQRVFASSAQNRPDGTVAVSLGKGRIVLRKGNPAAKVDHFAIGIDHFNKDSAIAGLKARGATPLEEGDATFHVVEPDGYPVQMIPSDAA